MNHSHLNGTGKIGKNIGTKRLLKTTRELLLGITKPAIRRLARRGGVKRISTDVYNETREVLRVFLEGIVRDACIYTQSAQRKTVQARDIVAALQRNGRRLYGFN